MKNNRKIYALSWSSNSAHARPESRITFNHGCQKVKLTKLFEGFYEIHKALEYRTIHNFRD